MDREVIHEALQERDAVARYLHAIADGVASGTLRLSNDDTELELHPRALIGFELLAHRDRGRAKLRLRLSWREDVIPSEASEGLRIDSQ